MPKLTPINNLFHDRGAMSSTKYAMLSSTTFKLGYYDYCIHCGEKAASVQGGLCSSLRNTEFQHYDVTDHRCNCDKAIDEIAEHLAFSVLQSKCKYPLFQHEPEFTVKREHYLAILQSKDSPDLPLGGRHTGDRMAPRVSTPNQRDFDRFLEIESMDISMYTRDSYYEFTAIYQFMTLVEAKIEVARQNAVKQLEKQTADVRAIEIDLRKR